MCDKYSKTIIKTSEWDRVYIVKYIVKNFNEFVLIFVIYTSHSEIIFSVTASDTSSHIQIYKHNFMINFLDVDTVLLNKKIKIYKF